jgi:group I intron endonuclease
MGQLYRLDFPNGKAYTGITTRTMKARFAQHQYVASRAKTNCAAVYSAWRKYGAPELTVLAIVEDEDLFETEKRAVAVFGTLAPGGYNLTEGGEAGCSQHPEARAKIAAAAAGRTHSAAARAKLSAAATGRKQSPEAIAKTASANRGKTVSDATRAKISAAKRGRKQSPETIAKRGAANRGQKHSAETRDKIGDAHRGKTVSDATRARISAANRSPSPETRAKLSAAAKAQWAAKRLSGLV